MSTKPLHEVLTGDAEPIITCWYDVRRRGDHPHLELDEDALKNGFARQLRTIAEQLRDLDHAAPPGSLWSAEGALAPEARALQRMPIEELVQEYGLLVDTVRGWIEDHHFDVSFREYSYFYQAIFELIAESVRRYAHFQAEGVARERAEFLAGFTHQMRTPLTVLALHLKMLEMARSAPDAGSIETMQRNLRRLSSLLNGVMRLERIKPEDLPVRPRPVRIARLVDEIVTECEAEAVAKGLRLEVLLDWSLRAELDPELFRDALGNLLENAIQYTATGTVRLEVSEEENSLRFLVRDSGPGIPPERQASLFDLVSPGRAGRPGVGLAVASRAVRAQGGEIGLHSAPGKGSVFWFRLPKKPALARAA